MAETREARLMYLLGQLAGALGQYPEFKGVEQTVADKIAEINDDAFNEPYFEEWDSPWCQIASSPQFPDTSGFRVRFGEETDAARAWVMAIVHSEAQPLSGGYLVTLQALLDLAGGQAVTRQQAAEIDKEAR